MRSFLKIILIPQEWAGWEKMGFRNCLQHSHKTRLTEVKEQGGQRETKNEEKL